MQYFELTDPDAAFTRYIREGGMSGSYLYKTPESKYAYISDVFNTLIVRDIRQKYRIRNMPFMERLCDFLIDNISNQTSTRSVAATFIGESISTNDRTVSAYIKYLCVLQDQTVRHPGETVSCLQRQVLPQRSFIQVRQAGHKKCRLRQDDRKHRGDRAAEARVQGIRRRTVQKKR